MATLNLDAKRAARDEATNTPHEVIFGGETFHFPSFMPLEFLDLLDAGKMRAAFALLLGEDADADPPGGDQTARFFAHRPDHGDLREISRALYSTSLGESPASPPSSANGGRPSNPTGSPTTDGTLPLTATDPAS